MASKQPKNPTRQPAGKKPARGGAPRPAKTAPAKKPTAKKAAASNTAAPKKPGRPSDYDPAIAHLICEKLAESDVSLRELCAKPGMPHRNTVGRWLAEHEDFAAKYARAREAQGEVIFDDMRAIEEKVLNRRLAPNAARVVLNNRQWRAAKLHPKRFGLAAGVGEGGDGVAGVMVLVKDLTGRKD